MRAMQLATRCRAKRDSHKKARLLRQAGQYREAEPRLGVWSLGGVRGIARGASRQAATVARGIFASGTEIPSLKNMTSSPTYRA